MIFEQQFFLFFLTRYVRKLANSNYEERKHVRGVALMKERSDSNNFNSLTATLIELRTSRCPQHGRLIRITSIPRALIPIVADQPFPQSFPAALYFTFSPTLFGGLGEVALASPRSNHRSELGEEVLTGRVYRAI